MAQPITWQNINAPSFGEANRLMGLAQQSILGAFDGAKTALADSQAFDKELWKRQDQDATQDALGKIYQAQTVDQFNAMNQSGALDQAVAANGARLDRAAINALRDGRVSTLQAREKEGWAFANAALDQKEAPTIDQVKGLLAQGKLEDTKPLIASLSARGQANMLGLLDQRERQLVERARGDAEFGWKGADESRKQAEEAQRVLLRPIAVQQAEANVKQTNDQMLTSAAQRSLANAQANALASKADDEAAARQAEVDRKILATALKDNPYSGGVLTPGSAEELAKLANTTKLGSGGSPEKLAKTMQRLTKIANEGVDVTVEGPDGKPVSKKIPVPLELAKAALLGSADTFWSWNEGYADTFENTIKERMDIIKKPSPDRRAWKANATPAAAVNPYAQGYADYLKIIDAGASVPSSKKK